ncbi:hypothetical protein VKT23_015744 [Stygiomarasmius scandens]|uniref:Uncharacterized protein n=1 Tax=Marasmiellus scandens TaxID=2682957 RepID=A0ABR1IZM7_9AGAR
MPGPSNGNKKKRKSQGKAQRKKGAVSNQPTVTTSTGQGQGDASCSPSPGPVVKENDKDRRCSDISFSSSSDSYDSPNRLRTPFIDGRDELLLNRDSEALNSVDVLDLDERLKGLQVGDVDGDGGGKLWEGVYESESQIPVMHLDDLVSFDDAYAYDGYEPLPLQDQDQAQYKERDQTHGPALDIFPQQPYIHDPGNGPRVRDTRAFLASAYFAQAPALDDPLCAEFAQEEVLQMLQTVLPDEMALILWYNKSRATSRICPACQRLYRLGDVLPDHKELMDSAEEESGSEYEREPGYSIEPSIPHPQLVREQQLSGICSTICFILASFNQFDPRGTKAAWGHTAEEIDEESWAVLNDRSAMPSGEGQSIARSLAMLVRMTRLPDLGLAQLCFPEVDWEGGEERKCDSEGDGKKAEEGLEKDISVKVI